MLVYCSGGVGEGTRQGKCWSTALMGWGKALGKVNEGRQGFTDGFYFETRLDGIKISILYKPKCVI